MVDQPAATDSYGTELALYGQPGDVVVYPLNFIGKRWAAGETEFIPAALAEMSREIGTVLAQHS